MNFFASGGMNIRLALNTQPSSSSSIFQELKLFHSSCLFKPFLLWFLACMGWMVLLSPFKNYRCVISTCFLAFQLRKRMHANVWSILNNSTYTAKITWTYWYRQYCFDCQVFVGKKRLLKIVVSYSQQWCISCWKSQCLNCFMRKL